MSITPIRREHLFLGSAPPTAFNDEFYGRRMQILQATGAGRLLDVDTDSLVAAAMGPLSDEDMVDQFIGAVDQIQFNGMKKRMEALPPQMQNGEFAQLTPQVQRLLRGAGYALPEEKDPEGLLQRIFTWDIPLLPEEHFGNPVKIGMAPIRAIGFGAGLIASNVWENAVMKPSRFATHFGRSLAYTAERGGAEFSNPATWKEAWDASRLEDGSYFRMTTNASIQKVGGFQTKLLKLWIREGPEGVYDYFKTAGGDQGPEEITRMYQNWYENLANEDMIQALEILESGKLTLPDASVRAWNKATPWDVRPGTKPATVIGVVGSLATEILLDPMTWVGGFYGKIAKAARAGMRGGQGVDTVDLWRRVAIAQRADGGKLGYGWGQLDIVNQVTGEKTNAAAEVRRWIDGGGWKSVAATNINVRAQGRAINKLIDRVNSAFVQLDEMDAFKDALRAADPQTLDELVVLRGQSGRVSDAPITNHEIKVLLEVQFGKGSELNLLLRDLPALNAVMDDMKLWHRSRRNGEWYSVVDDTGAILHRGPQSGPLGPGETRIVSATRPGQRDMPFATLAHEQGYWDFLKDGEGWNMISTKLGGVDPEAIHLPKIGAFGSQWMKTKGYMRGILDFDKFPLDVRADMARMASQYIAKQTSYVHDRIWADIRSGSLSVSKLAREGLDQPGLYKILDEPGLDVSTSTKAVGQIAEELGIEPGDIIKIEEARTLHQKNASQVILEDGELSDLLHWYQNNGYEVRGGELILKETADWFKPFQGAQKAAVNAYKTRIHPPGSMNAELVWAEAAGVGDQLKALGHAGVAGAFYYPARLAEKLTTYVPRNAFLDVTDSHTAISEFTALVDMGIMSGMSRTQIDNYVRTFVMGNESERWLVQNEFFMDYIGRSGALIHGGRDVQEFIQRFIRYGHQRYANVADDPVNINGVNVRRAIMPGTEHSAQLASANVLPNYRELASLTRYMGFYRWAGWGMHLPAVDKFLARTWRPSVLLRLGYVARNGGEEMLSWWLREGPRQWGNQKLAKATLGKHVVWDEYGRKVLKDLSAEEQLPMLWRPFSRLWRSFNEVAGVGDYAITRKALKESIETNSNWRFVGDDQRKAIFDSTRDIIKSQAESTIIGGTSRQLFELANAQAARLNHVMHMGAQVMGIPTKQMLARFVATTGRGRFRLDSKHEERVRVIQAALTNPTIIDTQTKDILGTFDTYLNFEKNTMDATMRQGGFGSPIYSNLKLPMNYGATKFQWVTNSPGSDLLAVDKSVAVTQRLSYMSDDPAHRAYLKELSSYSSVQQEQVFGEFATSMNLVVGDGESPAAAVLRYFQDDHGAALDEFAEAFDTRSTLSLIDREGVDGLIRQATAIDVFVEQMPDEIQSAVRKFLEPVPGTGQNSNPIAFLISRQDASKITTDLALVKQAAKRAFINEMLTSRGQQLLLSTHRSNVGFDALGGKISHPLPPGAARLFVPMISTDQLDNLIGALEAGRGSQWFEEFSRVLADEFRLIGLSESDARKTALLLQPGAHTDTAHHTPLLYAQLAANYAKGQGGTGYFPLLTVSHNPDTATAISKSIDRVFGVASPRARISSIDVNSEELFNAAGSAAAGRGPGPTIPVTRGRVTQPFRHEDLATRGDIDYVNEFYGWTGDGPRAAVDFGPEGLRDEQVFGIAGTMLFPRADGISPVQMVDNAPVVHKVKIYRHRRDGRTAVLRPGDERSHAWYNTNDWRVIDEQWVTHNDLKNAAEELALINSVEIDDLLTSSGRALGGEEEVFHPWIREVLSNNEISQDRVAIHANTAGWWDKAPDRLLALLPVSEEGATRLERIDKAWNTLLRNWFDGVVNPMIGAMVREPLFQHYLLVAREQTANVRRLHHHSAGAYKEMAQWLGGSATLDDNAQVIVKALTGFIESDWPVATMGPDELISKVAFAVENRSPQRFAETVAKLVENPKGIDAATLEVFKKLQRAAESGDTTVIDQFFNWATRSKKQFEVHRDVSLQRAMTLTSAFIDDHRIRSQFQQMVGTMIPFWFAEDQFLRRMGRSLKHNPKMLRNLHLMMNAGVNGGLVQEDQFGEKKLVIPGSEVAATYMLEIADEFPIVNRLFGGPLGVVARNGLQNGIAMNIHVVPGYDLEQIGQMGVGPLLAVPINLAAHRDPEMRKQYEHHLTGGRFSGASKLIESSADFTGLLTETIWSSVVPAVISRPLQILGADGGASRTKAEKDVLAVLAMNDMLPSEQDIADATNPRLFEEEFLDKVNTMAMHLQILQGLTWFFGPVAGQLSDLITHENWEWNTEFQGLLDAGVAYEDAYRIWIKNIEAREGEFNPIEFSPFRTSRTSKIPYAVLEGTQAANVWLTDNDQFVRGFTMASAFFMPRKFDVEDTEYVSEAKQRQINTGLRSMNTTEEYLEGLYGNAASSTYYKMRNDYLKRKYALTASGSDTTVVDRRWQAFMTAFTKRHPVFGYQITTGVSQERRDNTINEFRVLVGNQSLVPEGDHREDILAAMATIVDFNDALGALTGRQSATATDKRNALKLMYWREFESFIQGKPWLNEIYYSVFWPLVGDSWLAKYDAGLIDAPAVAMVG
jgi:hypothetical protein